jgi:hypothetical protein
MSQIRISQLPVANTVSDTTVIPVVQGGATEQATLAVVRAAITTPTSIVNGDTSVSIPDADGAVVVAVSANDSAMTQHEWQFETGGDLPGIRGPSGAAGFRIYSEELVQIGAQTETDNSVFVAQSGEAYVAVGNTAGTTFLTVSDAGVSVTAVGCSAPNLSAAGSVNVGNTLTISGVTVLSTQAPVGGSSETPTALSLAKSVQKLDGSNYSLANGVEGQIMYFVPATGNTRGSAVIVANARRWDYSNTGDAIVDQNLFWYPFDNVTAVIENNDTYAVSMAIFTDGAWNLQGGSRD